MRINILQGAFLPVPGVRGGAIEKAWFALGKEFASQGHEVTHISRLCDNLPRKETIDGVKHLRITGSDSVSNSLLLKVWELPYVWRSRKYLPEADVLVTHAFWAPILLPKQKFGRIYVHVGRYPKGQFKLYGKASRFQTPSLAIAEAVRRELPKRAEQIAMVPYPLPWLARAKIDWNDRPKRLLYIGRIHPEKGILELVRSWNELFLGKQTEWELRIIGPWKKEQGGGGLEYFNQIKNEIAGNRTQVEYVGPIFDQEKLKAEYERARIFAYPSLAEKGETFGLAVLEAMSCGCIPLVSSLACFKDFVSPCFAYVFSLSKFSLKEVMQKALKDENVHQERATQALEKSREFELKPISKKFLKDFDNM